MVADVVVWTDNRVKSIRGRVPGEGRWMYEREVCERSQNRPCRDVKDEVEFLERASDSHEHLHCEGLE